MEEEGKEGEEEVKEKWLNSVVALLMKKEEEEDEREEEDEEVMSFITPNTS